jgi:hypothetical protein
MPHGIHRLPIDKILQSAMSVRTDDQHVRMTFFHDTGDLLASVPESQHRMILKPLFAQRLAIPVQPFLVLAGFEIVAFVAQHPGRGALYHMDQQIAAGVTALTDGISQELLVVCAKVQRYGDMPEGGGSPVLQGGRLAERLFGCNAQSGGAD